MQSVILVNKNNLVLQLIIFLFANLILAQSGSDIAYLPIENLNTSYVGEQLFLDFKKDENDTKIYPLKTLSGFINKDAFTLSIDETVLIFRENWTFYADSQFLNNQYYSNVNTESQKLKDIYLEKITKTTLCLRANLYHNKQDIEAIKFEVPIAKVKGFLTRI